MTALATGWSASGGAKPSSRARRIYEALRSWSGPRQMTTRSAQGYCYARPRLARCPGRASDCPCLASYDQLPAAQRLVSRRRGARRQSLSPRRLRPPLARRSAPGRTARRHHCDRFPAQVARTDCQSSINLRSGQWLRWPTVRESRGHHKRGHWQVGPQYRVVVVVTDSIGCRQIFLPVSDLARSPHSACPPQRQSSRTGRRRRPRSSPRSSSCSAAWCPGCCCPRSRGSSRP